MQALWITRLRLKIKRKIPDSAHILCEAGEGSLLLQSARGERLCGEAQENASTKFNV